MSPVRSAPLLALLALLAGCAERPYLRSDYRIHQSGRVEVCYNKEKATPREVWQLAENVCERYDRTAELKLQQVGQCSWTAPSLAYFSCEARPGETPAPFVKQNAPLRQGAGSISIVP